MFPRTVEIAWREFQRKRDPRALAIVFDRTAPELQVLGRHLASPGTDADDLVQATFVTAIEDANSHRDGERLLPWLVGILVNHARAARRRSRRPLDAARLREPIADAADDVVANEVTSELRAAIDKLPEVYRPVLRLVCEHGLAANEIARTLERPAGTVRAQVTRGLELLRRTLPASLASGVAVTVAAGRGLAAVRSEVLARCGGTATGIASAVTLGGLFVLQHKLVAALAAVVLLALGWFVFEPEPASTTVAANEAPPPAAVTTPLAVDAAPAPANVPDRTMPNVPAPSVPPSAPEVAASTTGDLLVRVVDEHGTPCAGIGVDAMPWAATEEFGRANVHRPTDAQGEVRFAHLEPGDWAIDLDRVGVAEMAAVTAGRRTEQSVTLPAGITVRGHVRDHTGAPIPGALVAVVGNRTTTVLVATADDTGAFVVHHLTPGVELQARAPARAPSFAVQIHDGAAERAVDLVIREAACTITGRVLDANAQPLADAVVAILPAAAKRFTPATRDTPQPRALWLRTGADGTFRCDEATNGASLVFVDASSRGHAPAWRDVDPSSGAAFVDMRLVRGARLEGTVRRGGQPVRAVVQLWPLEAPPIGYLTNLFGARRTTTAADGTFQLSGLLPVRHTARALLGDGTLLERREVDLRPGETTIWGVETQRSEPLKIVVEGDAPLGGLRLTAFLRNSTLRDGEAPQMVSIGANRTASHTGPRSEPMDVVLAHLPGGASVMELAAVRNVPPGERSVKFVLTARDLPSRSIRGRLVDANAAPIANATVVASKSPVDGLHALLQARTGTDGSFILGPLPAGEYTLLDGVRDVRTLATAVLTLDRDEDVGDLRAPLR